MNSIPNKEADNLLIKLSKFVPGMLCQFQLFADGRSCFPFASDVCQEIYEVTAEEIKKDSSLVFSRIHPDDSEKVIASIQESARTLQPWNQEYRVILPQKGLRWLLGQSNPELLADGSILWHGIIRDISATKKAEQLLLRHKFITDTARDGFWVVNSKGYVLEVNQAYANMSGYSIAELKTMQIHQLEAAKSADDVKQHIADLIRTGSQCFETQHRHKNGTVFDVEVSVNYLYETDECFAFFRDISKRKQIEASLKENLKLFAAIFNNATVAMAQASFTGEFLHVNDAFCRMLGYTAEEVLAKKLSFKQITYSEDLAADLVAIQEMLSGSKKQHVREKRYIHKDGHPVWIFISAQLVKDDAGNPLYLIAVMIDISKRKRTETKLISSEEKFSKIFNASKVGIGISKISDSKFIDVNPTFCQIHGYSRAEIIGKTAVALNLWQFPEQRKEIMQKLLLEKSLKNIEITIRHKSGDILTLLICLDIIKIGEESCVLGVLNDISERKQLEGERQTLYAELESIVQQRTQELELSRQKLELTTQHLRDLAFEVDLASENERKQIAIEVHDELGQNLTALRMQIALLHYQERPQQNLPIDEMLNLVDQLIKQVRNVASNLYPIALDMGFKHALNWLVNQFSENTHIPCKLIIKVETVNFTQSVLIGLFRIIQESLTNVSRHAQASYVTVIVMRLTNNSLSLIIQDNGTGFDTKILNDHSHFGIFGMRERALSLHAQFEITSKIGHGTTIVLNIPDNHL